MGVELIISLLVIDNILLSLKNNGFKLFSINKIKRLPGKHAGKKFILVRESRLPPLQEALIQVE